MKVALHAQIPGNEDSTLSEALKGFGRATNWDSLRVAVAYASVAGFMHLLDVLRAPENAGFASQWLIGLDDFLTQPGVLRTCLTLDNAQLRIARLLRDGHRFHPKLLMVNNGAAKGLTCVGSPNLTLGGMRRNCEAFGTLTTETTADVKLLQRSWDSIWKLGSPVTEEEIDSYEREYNKRGRKPPDGDAETEPAEAASDAESESPILKNDSPETDPSLARTCWIEVGKNTAMGRELEFKAEQALFFGLSPSGAAPQYRQFIVSSGGSIPLR